MLLHRVQVNYKIQ